jgi:hypothetical protein
MLSGLIVGTAPATRDSSAISGRKAPIDRDHEGHSISTGRLVPQIKFCVESTSPTLGAIKSRAPVVNVGDAVDHGIGTRSSAPAHAADGDV